MKALRNCQCHNVVRVHQEEQVVTATWLNTFVARSRPGDYGSDDSDVVCNVKC